MRHVIDPREGCCRCAFALNEAGAEILIVDESHIGTAEVEGLKTLIYSGDGETPEGMLSMEAIHAASYAFGDRRVRRKRGRHC